jgi:hypothetical protein
MPYFDSSSKPYLLLQTDTTPLRKPHSPTLKDRTYVAIPNTVVAGNKPLDIGYDLSCINLSDSAHSWSLPLSMRRVALEQTASDCALSQLADLLKDPYLPFQHKSLVNTLDSKYGNARFFSPAHEHEQVLNIARLRAGMKVWKRYGGAYHGGAYRIYGEKYYLHEKSQYKTYPHPKTKQPVTVFQRSIFELTADEQEIIYTQTARSRKLKIQLWRYNDMMIRSKDGYNMKDKPFDLVAIRVSDARSGKILFDRSMYIAVCGQRKDQLPTRQAYDCYRHRYDIEPYLRFAKQQLFLQNYQTPDQEHLDNWMLILQLCSWLLYAASDEATYRPKKWEQYLPKNKQANDAPRLSIAQTRHAAQGLFLTFDPTPFKPQKSKKGNGRAKGTTFIPRKRYKVVKKVAHKRKLRHQIEQIE